MFLEVVKQLVSKLSKSLIFVSETIGFCFLLLATYSSQQAFPAIGRNTNIFLQTTFLGICKNSVHNLAFSLQRRICFPFFEIAVSCFSLFRKSTLRETYFQFPPLAGNVFLQKKIFSLDFSKKFKLHLANETARFTSTRS